MLLPCGIVAGKSSVAKEPNAVFILEFKIQRELHSCSQALVQI